MHLPIEHLKAGGTASRGSPMWQEHGLRLVLIGDINVVAGGLPFKAGEQVVIGVLLGIVNKDGVITPWAPHVGDLLAEDWKLIDIVEQPTEDPLA